MPDAVAEKVISTLASVKRIPADTIKLLSKPAWRRQMSPISN